jgi:putative aldouronate transport system permease protein
VAALHEALVERCRSVALHHRQHQKVAVVVAGLTDALHERRHVLIGENGRRPPDGQQADHVGATAGEAPRRRIRRIAVFLNQPADPRAHVRIQRERWMYLFIIPGALYFLVFQYVPLLGNIIAFQNFSPFLGIRGSPFVGLANFRELFTDPDFRQALVNTLEIEFLQLLFAFPAPLALALVLNSILNERVKRSLQSIVYLPHFLSWVIVIALFQQIFGGAGFIDQMLRNQGLPTVNIMSNPAIFKPLVILQSIWKETGWGTIIFLAALTKIDTEQYEAAVVDGASS